MSLVHDPLWTTVYNDGGGQDIPGSIWFAYRVLWTESAGEGPRGTTLRIFIFDWIRSPMGGKYRIDLSASGDGGMGLGLSGYLYPGRNPPANDLGAGAETWLGLETALNFTWSGHFFDVTHWAFASFNQSGLPSRVLEPTRRQHENRISAQPQIPIAIANQLSVIGDVNDFAETQDENLAPCPAGGGRIYVVRTDSPTPMPNAPVWDDQDATFDALSSVVEPPPNSGYPFGGLYGLRLGRTRAQLLGRPRR